MILERVRRAVLLTALILTAAAGSRAEEAKTRVFVSIPPQQYIAERVGGDRVDVETLVHAGQSPETFEPTAKQMARLSESAFMFTIGFPFEQRLVDKLGKSGAGTQIAATDHDVMTAVATEAGGASGHAHGHGGADPHVWLDLQFMKRQAAVICEKLTARDSANRQYYEKNLAALAADLDSLDSRVRFILKPFEGRRFYVFHPAFGWFARAYGLIQTPIEVEGKEPGGAGLAALIDQASKDKVKAIFVQTGFSEKSARAVADAIGASIVPLDPLSSDFVNNYELMARRIVDWLSK